jgi:lactoylglutathione lyase
MRFGENGENRWLEVAPARIAGTGGAQPSHGQRARRRCDRVGTADVVGEHKSLSAIGGTDLDLEPMRTPGAPLLSGLRDPDGNRIFVVEAMGSALEHGPTRLQTPQR